MVMPVLAHRHMLCVTFAVFVFLGVNRWQSCHLKLLWEARVQEQLWLLVQQFFKRVEIANGSRRLFDNTPWQFSSGSEGLNTALDGSVLSF